MKPTPLLFLGIFASFATAWFGLIGASKAQIANLQPQVDEENGEIYPINISGVAEQGRNVYLSQGCNYCHTQFVRDPEVADDVKRGWGIRRTVARDYIYESGATIGVMRQGPDLSNLGAAQEEDSRRKYVQDPAWLYAHLYNPRFHVPDSTMPSYRHLFRKRAISGQPSPDALWLGADSGVDEGHEIVPTDDAKALVAYLLSLDRSHALNEVKGSTAPAAAAAPAAK